MEIDNILDALEYNDVESIIQYCECTYNNKTIEFRLINDEFGVIDDIEYKVGDDEWSLDYPGEIDEDIDMILNAINSAPYEVFHKSDVGAILKLNHESLKPQNLPAHLKTEFYVDDENGLILFSLLKNVVTLE